MGCDLVTAAERRATMNVVGGWEETGVLEAARVAFRAGSASVARMHDVRFLPTGAGLILALSFAACAAPPPPECPCKKAPDQETAEAQGHTHADAGHTHADAGHTPADQPAASGPRVIPHAELRTFENAGAKLTGIATRKLGATQVEVWRSSIAAGARTPVHTHASEEVFIVLSGRGVVHVGDSALPFEAPTTVIAPAGVAHWVENTGDVPTDQIVVVGAGSEITDADGRVMALPWRQ